MNVSSSADICKLGAYPFSNAMECEKSNFGRKKGGPFKNLLTVF